MQQNVTAKQATPTQLLDAGLTIGTDGWSNGHIAAIGTEVPTTVRNLRTYQPRTVEFSMHEMVTRNCVRDLSNYVPAEFVGFRDLHSNGGDVLDRDGVAVLRFKHDSQDACQYIAVNSHYFQWFMKQAPEQQWFASSSEFVLLGSASDCKHWTSAIMPLRYDFTEEPTVA